MIDIFLRKIGKRIVPLNKASEEALDKLGDGQFRAKITQPRNIDFHRKYFAMLDYAYHAWTPPSNTDHLPVHLRGYTPRKSAERFRKEMMIMSGFYDPVWKINGDMIMEPVSIAWGNMDEDEFQKVYDATLDVICEHVAKKYTGEELKNVMELVEEFE